MSGLAEVVLRTLTADHKCGLHAGPNSGPCRTCRRRTEVVTTAVLAYLAERLGSDEMRKAVGAALRAHLGFADAPADECDCCADTALAAVTAKLRNRE